MTADARRGSQTTEAFSNRVLVLFGSQVVTAGLGIFNGFFLAHLLGPSQKGDYYLLTMIPSTLVIVGELGIPQAFAFYSARSLTRGLLPGTVVLTGCVAVPILLVTLAVLTAMNAAVVPGLEPVLVVVPLLAVPFLLNATFTTGIVVGRQAARLLAIVNIGVSLTTTLMVLLLVGALGLGLWGAILAYWIVGVVLAAGYLVGSRRLIKGVPAAGAISYSGLLRYGLRFYPTHLTQFFAYRADVFLLAWLLAEPSAPLGYYSMAFAMAELVFFLPNAVSTFFFPHVAGAPREESDRQVPFVSRVTLIMSAAVGVALVPVASLAIVLILPAFKPALPALYILLPGVVAISVTKVLSGYLSGLGRTGLTSIVSILAFVANVALNLYLIPRYGILGASAASLLSYIMSSIVYSLIVARLAGARPSDFWVPRGSDVRFAATMTSSLVGRAWAGVRRRD